LWKEKKKWRGKGEKKRVLRGTQRGAEENLGSIRVIEMPLGRYPRKKRYIVTKVGSKGVKKEAK